MEEAIKSGENFAKNQTALPKNVAPVAGLVA
jgi:hypothetical protein